MLADRAVCRSAEALGWLYVVERPTLLHDTVLRSLQASIPDISTWHYLTAYDGVAGMRWQDLGHAMDDVATTPALGEQIRRGRARRVRVSSQLAYDRAGSVDRVRRSPRGRLIARYLGSRCR